MEKLLVAYDGSAPARRALETAAELAAEHHARVTVVSVIPQRLGLSVTIDPFDDERVHRSQLEDAVAYLASRGVSAETLEPKGDPATVIERIARDDGYDTVVVGSRGRGGAARLLLGSVSSHVASHFKGTVIIVH
jgi:nucleotide-binding universal stress UspA family protein